MRSDQRSKDICQEVRQIFKRAVNVFEGRVRGEDERDQELPDLFEGAVISMSGHKLPEDRRMKPYKFGFTAKETKEKSRRDFLYESLDKEFKTKGYRPSRDPGAFQK